MAGMQWAPRFSIEERAVRLQRRETGEWRTVGHEIGPVDLSYRFRRRRVIELVRLDVAWHDFWTQLIWRRTLVPMVLPLVRWLAARLPG